MSRPPARRPPPQKHDQFQATKAHGPPRARGPRPQKHDELQGTAPTGHKPTAPKTKKSLRAAGHHAHRPQRPTPPRRTIKTRRHAHPPERHCFKNMASTKLPSPQATKARGPPKGGRPLPQKHGKVKRHTAHTPQTPALPRRTINTGCHAHRPEGHCRKNMRSSMTPRPQATKANAAKAHY